MSSISFDKLDSTQFEGFCYDLLTDLGFLNIDWRRGTGLDASPADRGRDIVCQWERIDADNSKHFETWFVECKHYKKGLPPDKLQNLLSWAEAERPATVLFVVSNFLSNPAKDYLEIYRRTRNPAFRIKYWEKPNLIQMLQSRLGLIYKYEVADISTRKLAEIVAAEQEFFDKIWYDRHRLRQHQVESGQSQVEPEIWSEAMAAAKKMETIYDKNNLGPWSDFEWGMLCGKLSTLRWILGEEWDFLDT